MYIVENRIEFPNPITNMLKYRRFDLPAFMLCITKKLYSIKIDAINKAKAFFHLTSTILEMIGDLRMNDICGTTVKYFASS